jgi:hypothetical protein
MSLRLRAAERYVPGWAGRAAIGRLLAVTASAFGREPPPAGRLNREALLERYAAYTAREANAVLAGERTAAAASRRMWRNAFRIGRSLRRALGVRTRADAMRALRVAYRVIGIEVAADGTGELVVSRCAFSKRYTPEVCRLMSSLDAGVVAGLTDGGRLAFVERITEDRPRCIARIRWRGPER